jgi:hypothetical protein
MAKQKDQDHIDTKPDGIKHNDTQQNDIQHNDTKQNDMIECSHLFPVDPFL